MDINTYKDKVVAAISRQIGEEPQSIEVHYDFVVIELKKEQIYDTLKFLKESPDFQLDFLTTMCGIHFPEAGNKEFCLMYQLHNLRTNERLRLKTYMPESDMNMPTITTIFPTANWMEREAYDFYGFNFEGHPSLTRILNMDEMNYFPMRRQYQLEDAGRTDKDDKYFGR